MKFFYSRVSTAHQKEDRQIQLAEEQGYNKVYLEKVSGKDRNRPELNRMLENLREGDTVTVLSIDRLGRNTRDILDIVNEIQEKGCVFECLEPRFDTKSAMGEFFLGILASLSEMERKQMLERQRQGIQIAKIQGKYRGRKPKELRDFEGVYRQWMEGKITSTQAGKLLEVSRATFYRRAKAYQEKQDEKEYIDF